MPRPRTPARFLPGLLAATGLALAAAAPAHAADPARSQRLPEGVESRELPDPDGQAKPLPEGEPAGRLPDDDTTRRDADRPEAGDAERVVWEAKREGVEDRLRAVRLELDEAREERAAACPTPDAEGCAALRRRVQRLEARERALAEYLETGMLAECLRTECDRDWVRGAAAPAN